jgi:hypothetical protein
MNAKINHAAAILILATAFTAHGQSSIGFNSTSGEVQSTNAGMFIAQLFIGNSATNNPLDSGWTVATSGGVPITATNTQTGALINGGTGFYQSVTVDSWPFTTQRNFMVAAWSTNLGTTWAQIAPLLTNNFSGVSGLFGVSNIGQGYGGGQVNTPSVFQTGILVSVSVHPFTLNQVGQLNTEVPLLNITLTNGQIQVSWPASFNGWTLQTNHNTTGAWGNWNGTASNNSVAVLLPNGNLFFRLVSGN